MIFLANYDPCIEKYTDSRHPTAQIRFKIIIYVYITYKFRRTRLLRREHNTVIDIGGNRKIIVLFCFTRLSVEKKENVFLTQKTHVIKDIMFVLKIWSFSTS